MTLKSNSQIKAAWIGGACIIVAAVLGAIIALHPWSAKKPPLGKSTLITYFVNGTVVNAKNNESISQAEVTVVGRTEQTTTEQNGNFSLMLHDSLSSIRIRITKPGFKTLDISSVIPNNNLLIQLAK